MTSFESSSKPSLLNKLIYAWPVLAFLGFLDASYLTIKHYTGENVACTTTGCETVLNSQYAAMFGVPLALFGGVYYLTLLVLGVIYLDGKKTLPVKLALLVVVLGILFSLYLVYLQFFVIHAVCWYCMGSAVTTLLLFILILSFRLKLTKATIN